ncbi:exocyst complex component EXO70C2 [Euphorbia lathyris]|uniref:exocyst complex component EXO70C2 n=1 Tax=Euphorbia lathyris TaxID=212925 RepID=UPI0033130C43
MDDNTSENKLLGKNSTTLSPHASTGTPSISDPDPVAGTSSTLPSETTTDQVNPIGTDKAADSIEEVENIEEVPSETHSTLASLCADIDDFLSSFSQRKETILAKHKDDKDIVDRDEKIPEYVDKFLDLIHEKIIEYESNDGKTKCSPDFSSFLEAINRVSKLTITLSEFISDPNLSELTNRIGCIHQEAMSYLEDEFRLVLEDYRSNSEDKNDEDNHNDNNNNNNDEKEKEKEKEEAKDPDSEVAVPEEDSFLGYGDEMIGNLNRIAKEMIAGGYESESCQVYMITRRHAFDEYLERVGFEKMSIDDVQKMQWEGLEREIPAWIKIFKDCATIYFSKERKLTEAVYSDSSSISSFLISNLVRGVMIQLLNFTEGIAMANRSAEKLFKFLDMYETLRDSIPAMDGLLPEECENDLIITEMTVAKSRIGEAAISIFCDLENSIKSDTGKTTVPGGAVHPLTRYTMNYLKYACEYMTTLEEVFKKHAKIERADSTNRQDYQGEESNMNTNSQENQPSPFSAQLMRLMDLLDSNLDAKAKLYKETALSNIFMMNNGRYIVQKIKGSPEIYQVVGESWCRKKSSDLRNYHKNYQRETWGKVLGCLGHEGLQSHGKVVKPVLKERFKNFNLLFDEIHRTQTTWVVCDDQLQSELRISISAVVIPAYRSFLGRFSQFLDPGRQYEKYIKYQPEDIEDCVDELFEGNTSAIPRRRP